MLAVSLQADRRDKAQGHCGAGTNGGDVPDRREASIVGMAGGDASVSRRREADCDLSSGVFAARSKPEEACLGRLADCHAGVGVGVADAEVVDFAETISRGVNILGKLYGIVFRRLEEIPQNPMVSGERVPRPSTSLCCGKNHSTVWR